MPETSEKIKLKINELIDFLVSETVQIVRKELILENSVRDEKSLHQTTFEILNVKQVANLLNVKERTIYEWVRAGKIPSRKLGDLLRFEKSEILKWFENS